MPGVEALRVIAAYTVLLQHAVLLTLGIDRLGRTSLVNTLGPASGIAVNVFFVISGLLLGPPLLEGRPLRAFVRSRVVRLTPLYYLVGLSMAALLLIGPGQAPIRAALSHFTYSSIYSGYFLFGSAWTLCVEFAFIFLLPVVCLLARRLDSVGARIACLVTLGFAAHIAARLVIDGPLHGQGALKLAPLSGLLPLLLGVSVGILARAPAGEPLRRLQDHWVLITIAVVSTWWAASAFAPEFSLPILISVASTALIAATLRRSSPLAGAGRYTYGIYLWHLPIVEAVLLVEHGRFHDSYIPDTPWPGVLSTLVIVAVLSTALAWFTYHYCEMPLMRLARARTRRGPSLEAPSRAMPVSTDTLAG